MCKLSIHLGDQTKIKLTKTKLSVAKTTLSKAIRS